jgi:FkbM family methyltransferase
MNRYSLFFSVIFFLAFSACPQIFGYPKYQTYPVSEKNSPGGSYYDFLKPIDKNQVRSIFEIGSRDALDAVTLSNYFECHVYAFECNPDAIQICRKTIGQNPNVTLVPLAVWDKNCEISFFQVPEGNIGASSCFQFNPDAKNYPDIVEEGLYQKEIKVQATRIDTFLKQNNIENIDLICMDVQGAAYEVVKSLGSYLKTVKYIITELETHPIYKGEVLYKEFDRFMQKNGFVRKSPRLKRNGLFGDVLYVNSALLKKAGTNERLSK